MDCYLIKKKYRNKNSLEKPYQEAKLFFVFKNYKFKGYSKKKQVIILEITMIFPGSKLVILTNKNRLIKTIREKYYTSSIKYMNFSQFDTFLNSHSKDIDIIELKKMKIYMKEEDVSIIFWEIYKKCELKIDNNNKEISITNLPKYYYEEIKNEMYQSGYILKNMGERFSFNFYDINFI